MAGDGCAGDRWSAKGWGEFATGCLSITDGMQMQGIGVGIVAGTAIALGSAAVSTPVAVTVGIVAFVAAVICFAFGTYDIYHGTVIIGDCFSDENKADERTPFSETTTEQLARTLNDEANSYYNGRNKHDDDDPEPNPQTTDEGNSQCPSDSEGGVEYPRRR